MTPNITASDSNGTLQLNVTLPKDYYNKEESFTHIYTNLNRLSDYTFKYNNPISSNKINNYSKMLPSQITEEQIFADFITYSGYDGLDLLTTLLPNDQNGTLTIQVELTNNYPRSVASINTFQLISGKYISTKTFSNFLTTNQFQQQYVVNFKNNNDSSLTSIKNLEVNSIINQLKNGGLTIDGKTYKNEEELVELFIASKGIKIPQIQNNNVKLYIDNESGILTFELLFPEAETGLSYPLSFTETFTGFLQGVAIPTSDIFIFKNQSSLDKKIVSQLPSQIANQLKTTPTLVKEYFVANLGGQFINLIKDSNNFIIETFANDLTGTLGIIIKFNGLSNSNTLKIYSKSYQGFAKL